MYDGQNESEFKKQHSEKATLICRCHGGVFVYVYSHIQSGRFILWWIHRGSQSWGYN
mgnify:CR=1 FL=1